MGSNPVDRERDLLLHLCAEFRMLLDAFWVPEEELVSLGDRSHRTSNDVSRGVHGLPVEGTQGKRYAGVRSQLSEQMNTQEGKQN